jgi:ribosomal protein L29
MYDLKTELMKLNAQVAIGTTPKNTKQIREIKKALARSETLHMQNFKKDLSKLTTSKTKSKKYIHR